MGNGFSCRSASLKLSNALISPLEGNLNPAAAAAKTVISNRLQWVRSSIRKKLDMNQVASNASHCPHKNPNTGTSNTADGAVEATVESRETPSINGSQKPLKKELNGGVSSHVSEEIVEQPSTQNNSVVSNGTAVSPGRTVVTHGDPLGALGNGEKAAPTTVAAATDTKNLKGKANQKAVATKSFVVPDSNVRLFVDPSSSEETDDDDNDDSDEDEDDDDDDDTDSDETTDEDEEDEDEHSYSGMASKLSLG